MTTIAQYIFVVIVWGTTWIAIKLQIETVPLENSIFYRFAIACIILFIYLFFSKKLTRISFKDHIFCALQGFFLFCINFYFIYQATHYIASGLVAVVFAASTIFNIFNNKIFNAISTTKLNIIGSIIGISGLVLIFLPDLNVLDNYQNKIIGLALAAIGTYFFSCGNIISIRHKKHNLPLLLTNAWGMFYGTIFMFFISLALIGDFTFSFTNEYIYSLLFLVLPGSVLVFAAYLSLVQKLGAVKASYLTVLFPIVALTISYFLEGFIFNITVVMGIVLVIIGNIVMFIRSSQKASIT